MRSPAGRGVILAVAVATWTAACDEEEKPVYAGSRLDGVAS